MSDIEQGTWSGVDKEPPPRSDEDRQFAEWCCTSHALRFKPETPTTPMPHRPTSPKSDRTIEFALEVGGL
jgi:hypothetical protein